MKLLSQRIGEMLMNKMNVLYLTNIPSPYRVAYFNELGKLCNLTVLFEEQTSKARNDSWKDYEFRNFNGIIMQGIRFGVDTAFCPSVIKYLKRAQYDYIILTVLASPTGILAAAWLKLLHIQYCFEGDGGVPGKIYGMKAFLKKFIISSAQLCFSTTKSFDDYCMIYGAKKEQIMRVPFSSVYAKDILKEIVKDEDKVALKECLTMPEERIILSVGQIIHRKGFDILLNAFNEAVKLYGGGVGTLYNWRKYK